MTFKKRFWINLKTKPELNKVYKLVHLGKAIVVTKLYNIHSFSPSPWIVQVEVYDL